MKLFYLEHQRNDSDHTHVKVLGIFSSLDAAENAMNQSVKLPGFDKYPGGFSIIGCDVNGPAFDKQIQNYVFILGYVTNEDICDDFEIMGLFASEALAEQAMKEMDGSGKYCDYVDGFWIQKLVIDKLEWDTGFFDDP